MPKYSVILFETILQSMDYIPMYIADSWTWNKRLSEY